MKFADTDWDWFFSSLAQSAAAIVAIFAGFIINKILANQAAHQATIDEMTRLRTEAEHLRDEADGLYLDWYSERKTEFAVEKVRELLSDPNEAPAEGWTADTLMDQVRMSEFRTHAQNRRVVAELLDAHLEEQETRRKERESVRKMDFSPLSDLSGFASSAYAERRPIFVPRPWNAKLRDDVQTELENIDAVRRKVRHHIRVISDCLAASGRTAANQHAMRYWLSLVVVLFLAGVIYPLSFLPSPKSPELAFTWSAVSASLWSLRGMLLALVSVAFLAVVGVFARINEQSRQPVELVGKLKDFSKPGSYTETFAVAEEGNSADSERGGTPDAAAPDPAAGE
jgi:hypothetical protein